MANQTKAVKKPLTKAQFMQTLADQTGLSKSQVTEVFAALSATIQKQIGRNSPGAISIPGLVKIEKKRKPAVKGGVEKTNPFTGEPMVTKAKPACNVVKVRALKALKDMV